MTQKTRSPLCRLMLFIVVGSVAATLVTIAHQVAFDLPEQKNACSQAARKRSQKTVPDPPVRLLVRSQSPHLP